MSRPRIALLNASFNQENTSRNFRRELDADFAEFNVVDGQLPVPMDFDGVVITGSGASVYWEEDWISDLIFWTRDAVEQGIPHLGVCYGHQVLAMALGGTVQDMGEYELGYRTIHRVGDSRLLDGLDDSFLAFVSHSDRVTGLPDGARLTAENDYGVHGFERDNVFTIQSHPEFDLNTAERLTKNKELPEERIASVLVGVTEENYSAACVSKQVFDNFVQIVTEQTVTAAD